MLTNQQGDCVRYGQDRDVERKWHVSVVFLHHNLQRKFYDGICQGVDLSVKLLYFAYFANQFNNPIKLALFTIFRVFSCIFDRNWFILH